MKSNTVRIGKRIMAVMLSLMMVAGIFAGMKLDVEAAESIEININNITTSENEAWLYYDNVTYQDKITFKFPNHLDYKKVNGVAIPPHVSSFDYPLTDILEKGKSYKLSVKI